MAECEDRREIAGEEEEETTGSKEHNGGAGFFRLCHLGSNTCTWDEQTVEGLRGARLLVKCKYLQRGLYWRWQAYERVEGMAGVAGVSFNRNLN